MNADEWEEINGARFDAEFFDHDEPSTLTITNPSAKSMKAIQVSFNWEKRELTARVQHFDHEDELTRRVAFVDRAMTGGTLAGLPLEVEPHGYRRGYLDACEMVKDILRKETPRDQT